MLEIIKSIIPPAIRPGYWGSQFLKHIQNEGKIAGGIFIDMYYVSQSVCGSIAPKFLGIYEAELIPVFQELFQLPFNYIIDVGSAEGYYAVGCALKFPQSHIIAYEATEEGRELLGQVILANKVSDRVEIRGYCTSEALKAETSSHDNGLLIMDVEGSEEELLSLHESSDLKKYYILIEIHDWVDQSMGNRILKKFSLTHSVQEIWSRPRKFSDFKLPYFAPLRFYMFPSLLAFSYERPVPMRWFYMKPNALVFPNCDS